MAPLPQRFCPKKYGTDRFAATDQNSASLPVRISSRTCGTPISRIMAAGSCRQFQRGAGRAKPRLYPPSGPRRA
jgi:hypothetical protein